MFLTKILVTNFSYEQHVQHIVIAFLKCSYLKQSNFISYPNLGILFYLGHITSVT